jgi:hypothetical protein
MITLEGTSRCLLKIVSLLAFTRVAAT